MWRFMALANSVFARCDDSSGTVSSIFRAACHDLGEMAQTAKVSPEELAERTFNTLIDNDYGQYDELIAVLTPALGPTRNTKGDRRSPTFVPTPPLAWRNCPRCSCAN